MIVRICRKVYASASISHAAPPSLLDRQGRCESYDAPMTSTAAPCTRPASRSSRAALASAKG